MFMYTASNSAKSMWVTWLLSDTCFTLLQGQFRFALSMTTSGHWPSALVFHWEWHFHICAAWWVLPFVHNWIGFCLCCSGAGNNGLALSCQTSPLAKMIGFGSGCWLQEGYTKNYRPSLSLDTVLYQNALSLVICSWLIIMICIFIKSNDETYSDILYVHLAFDRL
jgi:hypothetical protein